VTETARIGLLGKGTVGGAFYELLRERADYVASVSGKRPEIAGVLRRSEGDFEEILAASDIVVELMGGTDPAREYVLRALGSGKHVVTANKQLLAQHGDELFEAARANGVQLRFEAAVAGVVPVIRVIQESLAATEITKVFGIVNGTTNFILTEMARTGATLRRCSSGLRSSGTRRPTPPTTSAARTRRRRWRSSRGSRSTRRSA